MKTFFLLTCLMLVTTRLALAQEAAPAWQQPYVGDEAVGEHVIGLWRFDAGNEKADSSGRGHNIVQLRGQTRFVAEGKFGGALESFASDPEQENNKPEGVMIKNHPSLTPAGAFTVELWLKAKPELESYRQAILVDKKYYHYNKPDLPKANRDYCLLLNKAGTQWKLAAWLGYGEDSSMYDSAPVKIEPGQWHHAAFTYDGAGGGRFFLDGKPVGKIKHENRGPVAAGEYALHIGARVGSTHVGFPGFIDEVRITNGVPAAFAGQLDTAPGGGRTAFVRMEPHAAARLDVTNDTNETLHNLRASVRLGELDKTLTIPDLDEGQTTTIEAPVDTALRPGAYDLQILVTGETKTGSVRSVERTIPIHIVARPLPDQMPVVLWGGGDIPQLKKFGFTHDLVWMSDYRRVWEAGAPTTSVSPGAVPAQAAKLDQYLVEGLKAVSYTYPGSWLRREGGAGDELKTKYERIDRQGKPYGRTDICASFPELQQFAYNMGASLAQTFAGFPAFEGVLVHSEVRDATNVCFHEHDYANFRDFAGYDIPELVVSKGGVRHGSIKDFPTDRIVPDDHPILTFYRWFWKQGDGWNEMHTQVSKGIHSSPRKDLWTFFDPAVRAPSVWGSGGEVDVVSQWTYSYPDPIKIGQATDELFAMAAGRPEQQVMKMTQIIWYRSQTAKNLPEDEAKRVPWENDIPDAQFITISPDHLREAFWSKISRPIRGIMYHGWGSLVDRGPVHAYRFTNARTGEVLSELTQSVVRPLGPTLLNVPDRPADVALLESFSSQVFAGRGTSGWGGTWEADMHLLLQWAHLQPQIVYEEAVVRDGLDQFKVLVIPAGDVLPRSVADRILAWQRGGGIVVADEFVTPGVIPDIMVPSYKRVGKPDVDKATLQARAAALRAELDPLYQRRGEASDPDLVVRFRMYGEADYLFAINDKRTYGNYVGQHGMVMEDGLPHGGTITVHRQEGHVYDLVTHTAIPARTGTAGLEFDVAYGPGDGRVYLICSQNIAAVQVDAPAEARLGQSLTIGAAVLDDQRQPMAAVIPTQVEIIDAKGHPAEFTGYYAAKDGRLSITIDLAHNDAPGNWTIRVTELASGLSQEKTVRVR